jgi:hypothetical protein
MISPSTRIEPFERGEQAVDLRQAKGLAGEGRAIPPHVLKVTLHAHGAEEEPPEMDA